MSEIFKCQRRGDIARVWFDQMQTSGWSSAILQRVKLEVTERNHHLSSPNEENGQQGIEWPTGRSMSLCQYYWIMPGQEATCSQPWSAVDSVSVNAGWGLTVVLLWNHAVSTSYDVLLPLKDVIGMHWLSYNDGAMLRWTVGLPYFFLHPSSLPLSSLTFILSTRVSSCNGPSFTQGNCYKDDNYGKAADPLDESGQGSDGNYTAI